MRRIFVNHTNHPSENWSEEQKVAAEKFGEIVDVAFPLISPSADENEICAEVEKNLREILKMSPSAVLCQGEFNYTYAMVEALKHENILVLAATSERVTSESVQDDGTTKRVSIFQFVRFRRY